MARGPQIRGVQSLRRTTGTVQRYNPVFARRFDQGKTVPANSCRGGLAYAQHNSGGNGRVNRVAAGFKYLNSNFCGQRMRSCAHAVLGKHG